MARIGYPEDCPFTPQQMRALFHTACGRSEKQAAAVMKISRSAVGEHLMQARRTAGVDTTVQLVLLAVDEGWLDIGTVRARWQQPAGVFSRA